MGSLEYSINRRDSLTPKTEDSSYVSKATIPGICAEQRAYHIRIGQMGLGISLVRAIERREFQRISNEENRLVKNMSTNDIICAMFVLG